MSCVTSYYHFVFCTYRRRNTIPEMYERELYAYIFGIATNRKCQLIRIGGTTNHIHLLVNLAPDMSPSSFAQIVKQSSSRWMHGNPHFKSFERWGKEYYGFSKSQCHVPMIKRYIAAQKEHHAKMPFMEELRELMVEAGMLPTEIELVLQRMDRRETGDIQPLQG